MAKLFAINGDPDQTPHSAASNLGLRSLSITLLRVSRLQWVKAVYNFVSVFIVSLTVDTSGMDGSGETI